MSNTNIDVKTLKDVKFNSIVKLIDNGDLLVRKLKYSLGYPGFLTVRVLHTQEVQHHHENTLVMEERE